MFSSISKWFHRLAKGWLILVIFGLFVLLIIVQGLFTLDPAIVEYGFLDSINIHSPAQIYTMLALYGESGRAQVILIATTWDFLLPMIYTLFFGLSISWLLKRSFKPESKLQKLNLVALGGIFDLLENALTILIVMVYPTQLLVLAWIKTITTTIKYFSGIPIIVVLLVGLVKAAINRFKVLC